MGKAAGARKAPLAIGRGDWQLLGALAAVALVLTSPAAIAQESVEKLAEQLASADRDTKREAAYALEKLGAEAKGALPALIKALDEPDKQVWSHAVAAIASIGPEAKDAVPVLMDDLDSRKSRGARDRERRQALFRSAHALSRIGVAAIPALTDALKGEDLGARIGAALALGGMGEAARDSVPSLMENLGHSDAELRRTSAEALAQIGSAALPSLSDALDTADPKVRESVLIGVAGMGRAAGTLSHRLFEQLSKEQDPAVRAALYPALHKIGAEPARLVPALLEALNAENEQVRRAATSTLLVMRSSHALALPPLKALVKEGDQKIAERAAVLLGRIGATAKDALPELLARASQPGVAPSYGEAVRQIGSAAVPQLLATVEKENVEAIDREHWAIRILSGIGGPAVPRLAEALSDSRAPVRVASASALAGMGMQAEPAEAALLAATSDSDARVRATALSALIASRASLKQTMPRIEAALSDEHPEVRLTALKVVPELGPDARQLAPRILEALRDKDARVRLAALAAVGPEATQAVPVLVPQLDDPDVQVAVIDALGRLAGAAEPAVPKLVDLLRGADKPTRLKVLATLARTASPSALTEISAVSKDSDPEVRAAAFTAYAQAERDETKKLEVLTAALDDSDGAVRRAAGEALGRLGEKARAAAPRLIVCLQRDEDRAFALEALKQIQLRDLPQLMELVNHGDTRVRIFACERLGRLGGEARDALPVLQELAQSRTVAENVQREARRAVRQIERR